MLQRVVNPELPDGAEKETKARRTRKPRKARKAEEGRKAREVTKAEAYDAKRSRKEERRAMARETKRDLCDEEVQVPDVHVDLHGFSQFYSRRWLWKAMSEPQEEDAAVSIRIHIDKPEEYTWLLRIQTSLPISPSREGRRAVIAGPYRDVHASLAMISSHMVYLPLMKEIDKQWEGIVQQLQKYDPAFDRDSWQYRGQRYDPEDLGLKLDFQSFIGHQDNADDESSDSGAIQTELGEKVKTQVMDDGGSAVAEVEEVPGEDKQDDADQYLCSLHEALASDDMAALAGWLRLVPPACLGWEARDFYVQCACQEAAQAKRKHVVTLLVDDLRDQQRRDEPPVPAAGPRGVRGENGLPEAALRNEA